jgi:uncharacterized membrane protein
MKKILLLALLALMLVLFITFAQGYLIDEVRITDALRDDNSVHENLLMTISNNTNDMFSFNLPEKAGNIVANDMIYQNSTLEIPLNCASCQLNVSYDLKDVVKKEADGTFSFSRTLNLPKKPARLDYSLALPPGYIIELNANDPSVVPTSTSMATDGKSVILRWIEQNPELPKGYFVKYKNYEQTTLSILDIGKEITESPVLLMCFITFLIGGAIGFCIFIFSAKNTKKDVASSLPFVPSSLLNPDEKEVINQLKKNNRKMGQKDIVKSLNWSKSKVSAIITNLEYKKIIKREKLGRSYKVELVKEVVDE